MITQPCPLTLYRFGGTDGVTWFNDVWSYDSRTNSWSQLECIGYIPTAREGHAAALVGDVMYVFGGRTEEGNDLGDLAAFRISSRRWYTFQNMGPSPSPRSGHSMTAIGKNIAVLAGEPSSAPRDAGELSLAYFLDTAKIRYPADSQSQIPADQRIQGHRRPSGDKTMIPQGRNITPVTNGTGNARQMGPESSSPIQRNGDFGNGGSRLPRVTGVTSPPGNMSSQSGFSGPSAGAPVSNEPNGPVEAKSANASQSGAVVAAVAAAGLAGSSAPNGPQSRQPTRPERPERPERPDRPFSPPMENGTRSVGPDPRTVVSSQPPKDVTGKARTTTMSPSFNNDNSYFDEESSPATYKPATYQPQAQPQPSADVSDGQLPPSRNASRAKRSQTPTERAAEGPRPSMDRPSMDQMSTERPSMDRPRPSMDRATMERPSMDKAPIERPSMDRQAMSRPSMEQFPERSASIPRRVESRQDQERELPVDSGLGSSPALSQLAGNLNKELEAEKSKNAWYVSELALARKAGYSSTGSGTSVLDERGVDSVRDDDKPLVEALLKMRAELVRVQTSIESQAKSTAERIAEVERQRDAAISEATFAKGKLAAYGTTSAQSDRALDGEDDRTHGLNRKLASTLAAHGELSKKMESLLQEKEAETRARTLAEEGLESHQKRVTELDNDRQRNASELESLRAELHEAQRTAREEAANGAEAVSAHQLLTVNHKDLTTRHEGVLEETKNHATVLTSLHEAVTASTSKTELLERQLEEERTARNELEAKLTQLKSQHEERTVELESTSRRLRDAEALSEQHATEARTHRQAVLAGLGRVKESSGMTSNIADERAVVLQQQVDKANVMVRQNQAAADVASEKLRRAEERIAGLEAYQDQTSREGLSMRKQMQAALKELRSLGDERARLQQQLQSQQLETNAISVQHSALKDILTERGISPSDLRKGRGIDSPTPASRFGASTPDIYRVRELEQQLEASQRTHDELKTHLDELQHREGITRSEYEEKLTALDNDHQAAAKYLRGTEKMLSKMKQELQRAKNQNAEQLEELEALRAKDISLTSRDVPDWEAHQQKMTSLETNLQSREADLENLRSSHQNVQTQLTTLQSSHDASRADLERLQQENRSLEERAKDAETKVQLLLDQVESHVDNYRRQSGQNPHTGMNGSAHHRGVSTATTATTNSNTSTATYPAGHTRDESMGAQSMYSNPEAGSEISQEDEPDGRNSMALDSLANELDALRSHWETTSKNYRESDRFDYDQRTPTTANSEGHGNTMVNWRHTLRDDSESNRESLVENPNNVMGDHFTNHDGYVQDHTGASPVAVDGGQ